jgi:uncharacterized protein (TIGR02453 family)
MAFFEKDFLDFFIELAPNNNKDWFDLNRERYANSVREPFKKFVAHMIEKMSKNMPELKELEPKDCTFRINRDIRFSKDKTPYKLRVSALITPGGKKKRSEDARGVYFELGPEHVRVYGGVFEVDKDDLYNIREGIAGSPAEFKQLYTDKKFKKIYGDIHGAKNKVIPKEFKEAGAEEPMIYNKQWYFFSQFEPETVLDDNLDKKIIECHKAGLPIKEYLNKLKNQ